MFDKLGLGGGSSVCDPQILCVCWKDLSLIIPAPGRSRHCSWNPFPSISLLPGRGFACCQPTYTRLHLAKIQILSSHNHPLFTFATFWFVTHNTFTHFSIYHRINLPESPSAHRIFPCIFVSSCMKKSTSLVLVSASPSSTRGFFFVHCILFDAEKLEPVILSI
jgi:hypothetical protein